VYRGTPSKRMNFKDYEENGIHYWPLFTSTSKNIDVANGFGDIIFKIHLSKENYPPTNINICKKLEVFNEEEVLLLPSF